MAVTVTKNIALNKLLTCASNKQYNLDPARGMKVPGNESSIIWNLCTREQTGLGTKSL